MKQHKILLAMSLLPEEDRKKIEREGVTPETMSALTKLYNAYKKPKAKGAFGKRGTNRKQELRSSTEYLAQLLAISKKKIEDELE